MSPEQRKKILAAAELLDGGDMAVLKKIIEFQDTLEKFQETLNSLPKNEKADYEPQESVDTEELGALDERISENTEKILSLEEIIPEIHNVQQSLDEYIKSWYQSQNNLKSEIARVEAKIPTKISLDPIEAQINSLREAVRILVQQSEEEPEEIEAVEIRNKLETLKEDERLDISAIKGVGKRLAKLSEDIVNRAISILDQRTSFLINKVSSLKDQVDRLDTSGGGHVIEDEGTPLTQRDNLNFTGSGVSVADTAGKTVVTITGSAGAALNKETPAGAVDDSNVTFTVSNEPFFINVNGGIYNVGDGIYASYVAGTITLNSAVGTGGFIKSYY